MQFFIQTPTDAAGNYSNISELLINVKDQAQNV
jgi:hypothetical protein